VRKILGIIAYRRDFLMNLTTLSSAPVKEAEFIEQMRILENEYNLRLVSVSPSPPTVNEQHETDVVLEYTQRDFFTGVPKYHINHGKSSSSRTTNKVVDNIEVFRKEQRRAKFIIVANRISTLNN
jgi:hypothetical protein